MDVRGFGHDFVEQFRTDDASGLAAELAYRFLFATFPFGIFVAALAAFVATWFGHGDPSGAVLSGLGDNLPPDVADTLRPELTRILGSTRPDLLSVGAIGALWAATSGTLALVKAMNRAYDVPETRPVVVRYAVGIGLTVLAGAGLIASFVTLIGGTLLMDTLVARAALPDDVARTLALVRWPVVFALLVVAVAVLLRIAPNVRPPWRLTLAGGVVFALAWIVATWALGLYVGNFSNYDATYGALAGFAVLMLWFYVTALVLVAAAEITAVLTKRLAPAVLVERREVTRAELEVTRTAERARDAASGAIETAAAAIDADAADGRDQRVPRRRASDADALAGVATSRAGRSGSRPGTAESRGR